MSHSFKKTPVCKQKTPGGKRWANRTCRRVPYELTDTMKNGGYKRAFESWDVCEFASCVPQCYSKLPKSDWRKWFYSK